ncbi:helix-turn-helix domain-containing protein [Pseudoalteromonas sp. MSK9-3]
MELGVSITEIAKTVKYHRATLYRELKRNQTHG